MMNFLEIRLIDILDIILVAYLLFQVYLLIRGTVAIKIFVGIFFTYLIWLIVKALNMQLLSSILGQVMGVGVIALLIVFQQELRRFFLLLGSRYFSKFDVSLESWFSFMVKQQPHVKVHSIVKACDRMSKSMTGALIAIANSSRLDTYAETGTTINASTSSILLETIFFKNGPMHDGAVIINNDKIFAARCVLPVSDNQFMPKHYGLRHRAAKGLSEITDAFVIVISEETGFISYVKYGNIYPNISPSELKQALEEEFLKSQVKKRTKTVVIK
jgi:diadenylate cyclase